MGVPIHVTAKAKVPPGEHFAIFKFRTWSRSVYEPNDDEVTAVEYEAYTDKGSWLAEIAHLEKRGEPYSAAVVKPARVTPKFDVEVQT